MQSSSEVFSRDIIDSQLTTQGWRLADGFSNRYEVVLEGGAQAIMFYATAMAAVACILNLLKPIT